MLSLLLDPLWHNMRLSTCNAERYIQDLELECPARCPCTSGEDRVARSCAPHHDQLQLGTSAHRGSPAPQRSSRRVCRDVGRFRVTVRRPKPRQGCSPPLCSLPQINITASHHDNFFSSQQGGFGHWKCSRDWESDRFALGSRWM